MKNSRTRCCAPWMTSGHIGNCCGWLSHDLSHETGSIRSIGGAFMRRKSSGEPCEPHPRETILILNLTSSKLYLPTHEPGPAVSRMHSYHHSGHSGNRGRGNDSSRASLTAAGEPKVARVSPLLDNGVSLASASSGSATGPRASGGAGNAPQRPKTPMQSCCSGRA
jgi:hypothetical protein